jgi:aconitase B
MVSSGLSIFLTSIDWACRGISGRDHACVAGDKKSVVESLINGNNDDFYLDLLTHCVPTGVDEAAYVKAGFLARACANDIANKGKGQAFFFKLCNGFKWVIHFFDQH